MKLLKVMPVLRSLLPALVIGAVAVVLGSCAYQQVMDERRSENQILKQQLQAEQERGERLQR